MVSKSSHYKELDKYADEILIWSKYPMAVIKLLEKNYKLKSAGIPKHDLGGNLKFLGET
jgi:hypothetical protein